MKKIDIAKKIYELTPSLHPSTIMSMYLFPNAEETTINKLLELFSEEDLQNILTDRLNAIEEENKNV